MPNRSITIDPVPQISPVPQTSEDNDMPIPTPREGEEQKEFIGRCMKAMNEEFPDNKQRNAVCYSTWRKSKGIDKAEIDKAAGEKGSNTDTTPMGPAFPSPGGKSRMASRIISKFPPHEVYCEPMAGAGSVFFRKSTRAGVEILNDLNKDIMSIYKFLQSGSDNDFQAFANHNWKASKNRWRALAKSKPKSLMDMAYRAWYVARFGWEGDTSADTQGYRQSETGRRAAITVKKLQKYRDRLRGVHLLSTDGIEVIQKFDGPDTMFLIDPPYPHAQRRKGLWREGLDWDDEQQGALINTLSNLKGKFILCQRDVCPLAKEKIGNGWHAIKMSTTMTMGTKGKDTHQKRYEVLIANMPLTGKVLKDDLSKGNSESMSASIRAPIVKADEDRHIAYVCVMEPGTVDAQGDITEAVDIEKALHLYMAKYRKVGLLHKSLLPNSYPVEAYIAPQDLTFEWNGNVTEIKKGSGIVGIYVGEEKVWKMVKNGELTGASITGSAVRVPAT